MAPIFSRAALALLLVAVPPIATGASEVSLRGVHPDKKHLFAGETFQCDGGKTHPMTAFGDNYCDCSDGTDEYGTSACPNGQFFCRNRGHMPSILFSSRVNDGICDCCDGSDEYNGYVNCQNTCLEAGSAARVQLATRAAAYNKGWQKQEAMKALANEKRAKWQSEKQSIEPSIQAQELVVEDLRAKKEAAEAEQKRIDEEKRKAEEAAKAAADSQEAVTGDAAAPPGEKPAGDAGSGEGATQAPHEEAAKEAPAVAADEAPREETPEERGRRIARQWTNDALAAGGDSAPASGGEAPPPPPTEGSPEPAEGEAADYGGPPLEKPADWDDEEDGPWEPPQNPTQKTALERAEAELSKAETRLEDLKQSVQKLDRLLSADGGPEGVYLAIADDCFSTRVDQYTYEMCIYGSARQDPSSTSLGSWGGFDAKDPSVFRFTGGAHCWNGPQRSLTVKAICGDESQLAEVSEPNRCEYAAKFYSPAACSEALVREAEEALKAAELEAASLHDELR